MFIHGGKTRFLSAHEKSWEKRKKNPGQSPPCAPISPSYIDSGEGSKEKEGLSKITSQQRREGGRKEKRGNLEEEGGKLCKKYGKGREGGREKVPHSGGGGGGRGDAFVYHLPSLFSFASAVISHRRQRTLHSPNVFRKKKLHLFFAHAMQFHHIQHSLRLYQFDCTEVMGANDRMKDKKGGFFS